MQDSERRNEKTLHQACSLATPVKPSRAAAPALAAAAAAVLKVIP